MGTYALLFTITERGFGGERERERERLLHSMGEEKAELAPKGSKREKRRL
jgi:hypothetical protein